MIVATTETIEGRRIKQVIGLVRGNTVRTRFIVKDILASLKNMIGGEITQYTKMLDDARKEAIDRMVQDAERQGANAVVAMRMTSSSVTEGSAEILAYGTAVEVE